MRTRPSVLMPLRNTAVRTMKATAERLRRADSRQLCYIHIGKCGGATVSAAISASPVIAEAFDRVTTTHVVRPVYKPRNRYLFVVRNPIDRALSAFNWRYRLVLDAATPDLRFPGEAQALARHGTLNALALALYDGDGDRVRPAAARDFRCIHHLRENIAYYLDPAWGVLTPDQIFAVLCQETLDADIRTVLGVPAPRRLHDNRSTTPDARVVLSDRARANLSRFLADDFAALQRLMTLFPLSAERRAVLLTDRAGA